MSEQSNDGLARPEDYLLPDTEEAILPSGLKATLLPPTRLEFFFQLGLLPGRLANAIAATPSVPEPLSPQEALERIYKIIVLVFVSPRFSLTPGPGEFHPRRLHDEDRRWVDDWSEKYLKFGGGGAGLEGFREREAGTVATPGPDGGEVALPAERVPEG